MDDGTVWFDIRCSSHGFIGQTLQPKASRKYHLMMYHAVPGPKGISG